MSNNDVPVLDQRTRGDQPSVGSTAVDNGAVPGEPEKLALSAGAVSDLLQLAIRGAEGNAWWRGYVAAHGTPSWVVSGRWRIVPQGGAEVVRLREQER
jgi:hypothetical protein